MDLRYPVGEYVRCEAAHPGARAEAIEQIAATPKNMRDAVAGLSHEQLGTPYRPGGWTVRQVVHHVPDSHMNSYVRLKLALTENEPTIRRTRNNCGRNLRIARTPIEVSLTCWKRCTSGGKFCCARCGRKIFRGRCATRRSAPMTVDNLVNLYAWHGRHHVAHITALREREGWK